MSEIENKNLVHAGDKSLTLLGKIVSVGDRLPEVSVSDQDLQPITLSSLRGKLLIISMVPSLDTPTCSAQTRRFNVEATGLSDQVVILTISNDLPFAQKRFCAAEGIDRVQVLSDYRGQTFGRSCGLFIKELYLLARAVLVVDQTGVVRYVQIVPNLPDEPEYAPVLEAVKKLL